MLITPIFIKSLIVEQFQAWLNFNLFYSNLSLPCQNLEDSLIEWLRDVGNLQISINPAESPLEVIQVLNLRTCMKG